MSILYLVDKLKTDECSKTSTRLNGLSKIIYNQILFVILCYSILSRILLSICKLRNISEKAFAGKPGFGKQDQ